jgi:hypothetical protein
MPRYAVSPSYFYTLGIPLLRGRTFTDHDDEQSSRVVVVNEALASRLWPGEDPVGKPFTLFGDQLTVVGVVGNIRHEGLSRGIEAEIYVPYLQANEFFMQLAVRTAVEPASMTSVIRAQLRGIDPDQPIYNVATLEQTLSDSVVPQHLNALLLGIFGFVALALATVGIYREGRAKAGGSVPFGGHHGGTWGDRRIWRRFRLIPSFFIRPRRVLGLSPKVRAAPFGPSINPLVFARTARIWRLSTSWREAGRAMSLVLQDAPLTTASLPMPSDRLTITSDASVGSWLTSRARTEPWDRTTALSIIF